MYAGAAHGAADAHASFCLLLASARASACTTVADVPGRRGVHAQCGRAQPAREWGRPRARCPMRAARLNQSRTKIGWCARHARVPRSCRATARAAPGSASDTVGRARHRAREDRSPARCICIGRGDPAGRATHRARGRAAAEPGMCADCGPTRGTTRDRSRCSRRGLLCARSGARSASAGPTARSGCATAQRTRWQWHRQSGPAVPARGLIPPTTPLPPASAPTVRGSGRPR
jgi:hypothetical protein